MPEESPFELVVAVDGRPGLRALLRNRSATARLCCHDRFWQTTLLELTATDGSRPRGQDQRVIMRPLYPIGREAFRELGPGDVEELMETDIERPGPGGYILRWGHQSFHGLPPGTYGVAAVLECIRTSWADEERQWHAEKDIWQDLLRSAEVRLELP